jgi:CRISPR-associated protein Csx10
MKRIKLEITALSPLAIADKKPGSISEAKDHIPGSVIRGTIAAQILQQSGQLNENLARDGRDFKELFLGENPAIFQNAYPAVAKKIGVVAEEIMVLPATAVSSKNSPGFKSDGNGVFDTLIDRYCAELYNFPYDPSCPKYRGRVEPYSGFYSQANKKYRNHSVSTRFLTRVGINRRRATSQEEILYSIEVLNESFLKDPDAKVKNWNPVVYRSSIMVGNDGLAGAITNYINRNSQVFRLGGATSRGLGKVAIAANIEDATSDVATRINTFNDHLKERWKLWKIFGSPKPEVSIDRTYFTLDLQSPAILTENWQRTTVISPKMLCQFVGLEDEYCKMNQEERDKFLKLEVAYSSYEYLSGWNSAWGLLKDMELMTNRGGVYLFSTDRQDVWFDKLKDLELKGAGDRTCEGFGQIQICNEFHLVFRDKPV